MSALTQVLCGEHRLIRRAAACLDQLADHALRTDDICVLSATELLEFFEDYADNMHQEKEERNLFPALLESGRARHRIRELLEEHNEERAILTEMRSNLEGAAYGDPMSRDRFVTDAGQLANLQREHAAQEERVLLPLAEELLSDTEIRRVLAGFRETEAQLLWRPAIHYAVLIERVETRLRAAHVPAG